jgi:hypothetical protein
MNNEAAACEILYVPGGKHKIMFQSGSGNQQISLRAYKPPLSELAPQYAGSPCSPLGNRQHTAAKFNESFSHFIFHTMFLRSFRAGISITDCL